MHFIPNIGRIIRGKFFRDELPDRLCHSPGSCSKLYLALQLKQIDRLCIDLLMTTFNRLIQKGSWWFFSLDFLSNIIFKLQVVKHVMDRPSQLPCFDNLILMTYSVVTKATTYLWRDKTVKPITFIDIHSTLFSGKSLISNSLPLHSIIP